MTAAELQAQNQENLRQIALQSAQIIKEYIDSRTDIPQDVLDRLNRADSLAQSLLALFDTDSDDTISQEEFFNKLNEIYATIRNVEEIRTQLLEVMQSLGALGERVDAIEANFGNYYTKSEIDVACSVDVAAIVGEVRAIFNPNSGDGATL